MDALAERLDTRLREWAPDTAGQVRERIAEIIDLADQGTLDLMGRVEMWRGGVG